MRERRGHLMVWLRKEDRIENFSHRDEDEEDEDDEDDDYPSITFRSPSHPPLSFWRGKERIGRG